MTGAGTLPSGEEPDGALSYGSLEDFSLLTGADFIIQLVNQITFAATGYTNLQDALEKIASQIGFPEFAELLLAAFEGITGSLLNFLPWFINLTDLLGFDLNIDPADFNPITVLTGLVERVLELLGLDNLLDMLGLGGIGGIFDDLFGLFGGAGSLGEAGNFLENILGIFNLGGGGSGLTQSPSAFNPIAAGVSLIDSFVPGVGNILDELFGGINLLGGIFGASHSQAQDAITGQASSLVNTNATVAQILAALGPGNVDADDFERTASTPGSTWDLYSTGTGTVGTPNGHDLSVGGSADFEYVMRRNTTVADDDGMTSAIVLGTAPASAPFLLPTEFGCNDVWIRMGSFTTWATRTGVRLRYQATKELSVVAFNSGTATTIMSATTITPPTAGSVLSIESIGATRQFIVRCGGYTTTVTEVGTASQVGASFRRRGLGGRTEDALLGTAHPGTTKQWTGQG